MERRPKYIVMNTRDTFSTLFWDDNGCGIGEYGVLDIGDDEISLSEVSGLKEWFRQADKYDPFTVVCQFTNEGMKEWINQGYEYAKQIRKIIPEDIDLYYGFLHQFDDNEWCYCKAYIHQ